MLWQGVQPDSLDFYGRFKLTWNAQKLFMLVEINDNIHSDMYSDPLVNHWINASEFGTLTLLDTSSTPTSVENVTKSNLINIYPNPAKDYLNIKLEENIPLGTLASFHDASGQVVKTSNIATDEFLHLIYDGDLRSGTYFIKIITKNNSIAQKIFIY